MSTWDLLHLLFYHGWHKAVYVLLYLEQIWELRSPGCLASMWPIYWKATQALSHTHTIVSSLVPCAVWLLQGHPYCSVASPPAWWQRWVCTHLGSGGSFSLSSLIAKILCDRAFPLSEIAAAVPPMLAPIGVESMFMCHTALGSMNSEWHCRYHRT